MTYNLQGMKPGTDPETRLINIIEKLKVIDPDIIGLQEINESLNGGGNDNQAKRIADSLSAFFGVEYHYFISFTHLSWNNQFREFVGIISKFLLKKKDSYL
jgi:endonuclease/exonuclease/phosphatase family metal-dependent hydrolase